MMTPLAPEKKRFRYADYVTWPEDERWEIIDGVAWNMTPAPGTTHQRISVALTAALHAHFRRSSCQVFVAPTDVLLTHGDEPDDDVGTVVQPDLLVVCDSAKVQEKFVRGAPDLVVEIISPSTARKDERIKRDSYQTAGVAEYWLVHPTDRTVHRYKMEEGSYRLPDVYGPEDGEMPSSRFPNLTLDLREVFGEERQGHG